MRELSALPPAILMDEGEEDGEVSLFYKVP